jgi:predicted AAA+ superfamily ATPase
VRHDFTSGYVRRVVDAQLDDLLGQLPALLLDGPKAVGKTATAEQRAATVWQLHRPGVARVVEADPLLALRADPPVLFDEYQRVQPLWDEVKDFVDRDPASGRVLLTGSAPPPGSHSGAGRIAALRLRPLTLPERGSSDPTVSLAAMFDGGGAAAIGGRCALRLDDYTELILGSGFPGMQHLTGNALTTQLDGYLDRIADRDLVEAGLRVRRPATFKAWLRAYSAAVATTASWEKIRDAASPGHGDKPAKTTTLPYIDALTQLRILDELPAWAPSRNHLNRLTGTPKHHLADPALAARLTGMNKTRLLTGAGGAFTPNDGTYLGQLFESLATLSVRVFAGSCAAEVSHLRLDSGRHEVDVITERAEDGAVVAFEVKLSADVGDDDVKHLLWLREQLGDQFADGAVLTTGEHAYRRPDGIAVVPLGLLGP